MSDAVDKGVGKRGLLGGQVVFNEENCVRLGIVGMTSNSSPQCVWNGYTAVKQLSC